MQGEFGGAGRGPKALKDNGIGILRDKQQMGVRAVTSVRLHRSLFVHLFRLTHVVLAAAILTASCRAPSRAVPITQRQVPLAGFTGCYLLESDGRLLSHYMGMVPHGLRLDTIALAAADSSAAAHRVAGRIDGSWFQPGPPAAPAGSWFLRRIAGADSLFVDFRTGLKGARFGFAVASLSHDSIVGWAGVSVHGDGNETLWRPVQAVRAPCVGVLAGVVRDSAGQAVAQARVEVPGGQRATTDALGRFAFPRPVFDPSRIVVRRLGYEHADQSVGDLARDSAGRVVITLKAPAPPTRPLAPLRVLNVHDDTIPDWELDLVARAGGHRPLREVSRRSGAPEIRIALHGGIGLPNEVVVLRRIRARATGEVWLWWGPFGATDGDRSDREQWRRHAGEYGCPQARWRLSTTIAEGRSDTTSVLFCRATLRPAPDWTRLWERLDSLGVWSLPDQAELPRTPWIVLDGITVTVEAFDGVRYRLYSHANPNPRWSAESTRARGIIDALDDILRTIVHRAPAGRPL